MVKSATKLRRRQFFALLMLVAFVFTTTDFLSHVDVKAHSSHGKVHCELCLAWSGGTVSPSVPDIVAAFALLARLPPGVRFTSAPARRLLTAHRSRAPPRSI
jgi:hypothetical protein